MEKQSTIAITLGIVVFFTIGALLLSEYSTTKSLSESVVQEIPNKALETSAEVTAPKRPGSYTTYEESKIAAAESGKVILFFAANWCPTCRALDNNIKANLLSIPDGVTILKTDYDKEKDLKVKYGVTYQHTLVQVNEKGEIIKKWNGSPTLADLISKTI